MDLEREFEYEYAWNLLLQIAYRLAHGDPEV